MNGLSYWRGRGADIWRFGYPGENLFNKLMDHGVPHKNLIKIHAITHWRKKDRIVVLVDCEQGRLRFEEPRSEFISEHLLAQLLLVL
jgi:hypothetical protein